MISNQRPNSGRRFSLLEVPRGSGCRPRSSSMSIVDVKNFSPTLTVSYRGAPHTPCTTPCFVSPRMAFSTQFSYDSPIQILTSSPKTVPRLRVLRVLSPRLKLLLTVALLSLALVLFLFRDTAGGHGRISDGNEEGCSDPTSCAAQDDPHNHTYFQRFWWGTSSWPQHFVSFDEHTAEASSTGPEQETQGQETVITEQGLVSEDGGGIEDVEADVGGTDQNVKQNREKLELQQPHRMKRYTVHGHYIEEPQLDSVQEDQTLQHPKLGEHAQYSPESVPAVEHQGWGGHWSQDAAMPSRQQEHYRDGAMTSQHQEDGDLPSQPQEYYRDGDLPSQPQECYRDGDMPSQPQEYYRDDDMPSQQQEYYPDGDMPSQHQDGAMPSRQQDDYPDGAMSSQHQDAAIPSQQYLQQQYFNEQYSQHQPDLKRQPYLPQQQLQQKPRNDEQGSRKLQETEHLDTRQQYVHEPMQAERSHYFQEQIASQNEVVTKNIQNRQQKVRMENQPRGQQRRQQQQQTRSRNSLPAGALGRRDEGRRRGGGSQSLRLPPGVNPHRYSQEDL